MLTSIDWIISARMPFLQARTRAQGQAKSLQDKAFVLGLEPLDSIVLGDGLELANPSGGATALRNTVACALQYDVEVHSVNTSSGVVLQAKIDVLSDTKPKTACTAAARRAAATEVDVLELELLDLEATLENLLSLRSADSDVSGDFFVSANTEGADGETGLGVHRCLAGELLEDAASASEAITRLANTNVEDELMNLKFTHRVRGVLLGCDHVESERGETETRSAVVVQKDVG